MDLSKFKPFTMVAGKSFVTISKSGVAFSQASVIELEKAEYVIVLFNATDKQMAVKIAKKGDADATTFFKPNKRVLSVRWNNAMLKAKISSMMDWNLQKHTYRVEGKYDADVHALIFDFQAAQEN